MCDSIAQLFAIDCCDVDFIVVFIYGLDVNAVLFIGTVLSVNWLFVHR